MLKSKNTTTEHVVSTKERIIIGEHKLWQLVRHLKSDDSYSNLLRILRTQLSRISERPLIMQKFYPVEDSNRCIQWAFTIQRNTVGNKGIVDIDIVYTSPKFNNQMRSISISCRYSTFEKALVILRDDEDLF